MASQSQQFDFSMRLSVRPTSVLTARACAIAALALSAITALAPSTQAQKAWVPVPAFGLSASETTVNPAISLIDILPVGMDKNIGAWDWISDDKVVFTNWIWNFTTTPMSDIWVMDGMKAQDKTKMTVKRYYPGNLREPLGVKVVNGEVYVVVKFALLRFVDADKDGIAEDTVRIVEFPHELEPEETWNHYSIDLKYKDGFFYVALPSETRGAGFPGYPVMHGRGTVAKIDPVKKTIEYVASGLRTPDGLGWGPDGNLFVTDNQGAWLPSSKLIHVTQNRFFGLQPVEAGDPSLVESPPAVWMPHGEGSSSPTQPMLLEKGPFAGQFLIGDNVLGVVNRASLEKVQDEYQGALFHFTGGLTCGVHRLLQNPAGDVYFGGLGSPINTWNVKGKFVGMQAARFNGKANFEVKEILSRADGFTLRFTAPAGESAKDAANYRIRQWRYLPTKAYGGNKLDNVALTVGAITLDASRTLAHIRVGGLKAGSVVDFQFHKDLASQDAQPLWTGEAWYTLNRISAETAPFPAGLKALGNMGDTRNIRVSGPSGQATLFLPAGAFTELELAHVDGRTALKLRVGGGGTVGLAGRGLTPGVYLASLRMAGGGLVRRSLLLP
jgi:hypothetical protein